METLRRAFPIPNTLGVKSMASYWLPLQDETQWADAAAFARKKSLPVCVVGGASNLILPERLNALVIHPEKSECIVIDEDNESVRLNVSAGMNWHQLVVETLEKGYFGLENLALIPGTVGASVIQNIGAYGVEVGQFIESVTALDLDLEQKKSDFVQKHFAQQQCELGYRNSFFKRSARIGKKWLILRVIFRLSKKPNANWSYGMLTKLATEDKSPRALFDAVVNLRSQKLPDPRSVGSVGSFFINPIVSDEHLQEILKKTPDLPYWPMATGYKIAAGALIEQLGWRGYVASSSTGVYSRQALVLVNYGRANGAAVLELAKRIQASVKNSYGVVLEIEPEQWV